MASRDAGLGLSVGALGVVFGDIGTSPLYAMRSILREAGGVDRSSVYGLTSAVIWSLLLVVTVLYVGLLLRTDNEGEGGLLALLALVRRTTTSQRVVAVTLVLGMLGAATFLGDSVITPAISVLSAAEGLTVASPSLHVIVVPVALAILVGVFVLQHTGSGAIGRFYGPVMVVWFLLLAAGGVGALVRSPGALAAVSPTWAVAYFVHDPGTAFLALGSVVLAVTGAEALYADLGHFDRSAITRAWFVLVLPSLIVAYLGEAGEVLRRPASAASPFYDGMPAWATYPVLVIATAATVIASEAVIAGGFTVLHQAGGLGILPSMRTRHTSAPHPGQIYLPAANWAFAAAVLAVVLGFRSSARLASAYGLAVSITVLATVSLYVTLQRLRGHRLRLVGGVLAALMMLAFFGATARKVVSGGWLPVLIGAVLFVVMWTWWRGQGRIAVSRAHEELGIRDLVDRIRRERPARVLGGGVFLTYAREVAPSGLRTVLDLGHVLPAQIVVLSWHVEDTPRSPAHEHAAKVVGLGEGLVSLDVALGYRDRLNVVDVVRRASEDTTELAGFDADTAYYYLSESWPRMRDDSPMPRWQQRIYLLLHRLATDRVDQLALPRDRSVSIGRDLSL